MILVVDASVACKWFVEEDGSQAAEALLDSGSTLLAPDLLVPEVCNVACIKLRRDQVTIEQAAAMVDDLPGFFDEFVASPGLATRAFAIANRLAHPAYDCFYLALAEARNAHFVTADTRFLRRLEGTPWAALAVELGKAATK
jgi:predicted nucleic acid-binding protein